MTGLNYVEDAEVFLSTGNFSFILPIFVLVMYWLVLEKAGESGWKILVPFFGEYVLFKIAQKERLFWWKLGLSFISTIGSIALIALSIVAINSPSEIMGIIIGLIVAGIFTLCINIAIIVIQIKYSIAFSKAFGQTAGFGIGILFLEPIFVAILALNKSISYNEEFNADIYN